MKTSIKIIIGAAAWIVIGLIVIPPIVTHHQTKKEKIREEQEMKPDILKGDDLVAVKGEDGKVSIKNEVTGVTTIKDIKLDWTSHSPNDSLSVFCSEKKRGYFNSFTGEIAIPAQYRRAWVFSEGVAAVQKNGMIGFIDHKGNAVIDFKFPYYGNPISEYVFKDGMCKVADTLGHCGVINRKGQWLIRPEYDDISIFKEYAIVSKAGVRMQMTYDGMVINSFVLDDIEKLTFSVSERYENKDGELEYVSKSIFTGLFAYRVGGRWGLMNSDCRRLTEPLYSHISAVDMNMFRARLLDSYSEVILNAKGEVMR